MFQYTERVSIQPTCTVAYLLSLLSSDLKQTFFFLLIQSGFDCQPWVYFFGSFGKLQYFMAVGWFFSREKTFTLYLFLEKQKSDITLISSSKPGIYLVYYAPRRPGLKVKKINRGPRLIHCGIQISIKVLTLVSCKLESSAKYCEKV